MSSFHELNPENIENIPDLRKIKYSDFHQYAPPSVVNFGYVPDFDELLAGDIILFRPVKKPEDPGKLGFVKSAFKKNFDFYIQSVQSNFQNEYHSQWVHAGLYLGRDLLLEAVRPRVKVSHLSERAVKECIRIRRIKDIEKEGPSIRYHACVEAMKRIGERYDMKAIFDLYRVAKKSRLDLSNKKLINLMKKAYICSEIPHFGYIYGAPDKRIVTFDAKRHPTPADLSASSLMRDVKVDWLPLT